MSRIQISGNANPNLPSYSVDEAERMLAEYPPGGAQPKTIGALAKRHWAKKAAAKNKPTLPAAAGDEDISDLIPAPRSHTEIWERFNAQGRGRMRGVK